MSVRCLECGTILIREAVPRPDGLPRDADPAGNFRYIVYGGMAGLFIGLGSWFVLSRDEATYKSWVAVCTVAGSAIGRYIAWRERDTL